MITIVNTNFEYGLNKKHIQEWQAMFCDSVGEFKGWMKIINKGDEILQLVEWK